MKTHVESSEEIRFSGENEGLGERLKFEGGRWYLIPGEESKFDGWRGKFVTFSSLRYEKCQWILAVQCTYGNTQGIWCAELTDFMTL